MKFPSPARKRHRTENGDHSPNYSGDSVQSPIEDPNESERSARTIDFTGIPLPLQPISSNVQALKDMDTENMTADLNTMQQLMQQLEKESGHLRMPLPSSPLPFKPTKKPSLDLRQPSPPSKKTPSQISDVRQNQSPERNKPIELSQNDSEPSSQADPWASPNQHRPALKNPFSPRFSVPGSMPRSARHTTPRSGRRNSRRLSADARALRDLFDHLDSPCPANTLSCTPQPQPQPKLRRSRRLSNSKPLDLEGDQDTPPKNETSEKKCNMSEDTDETSVGQKLRRRQSLEFPKLKELLAGGPMMEPETSPSDLNVGQSLMLDQLMKDLEEQETIKLQKGQEHRCQRNSSQGATLPLETTLEEPHAEHETSATIIKDGTEVTQEAATLEPDEVASLMARMKASPVAPPSIRHSASPGPKMHNTADSKHQRLSPSWRQSSREATASPNALLAFIESWNELKEETGSKIEDMPPSSTGDENGLVELKCENTTQSQLQKSSMEDANKTADTMLMRNILEGLQDTEDLSPSAANTANEEILQQISSLLEDGQSGISISGFHIETEIQEPSIERTKKYDELSPTQEDRQQKRSPTPGRRDTAEPMAMKAILASLMSPQNNQERKDTVALLMEELRSPSKPSSSNLTNSSVTQERSPELEQNHNIDTSDKDDERRNTASPSALQDFLLRCQTDTDASPKSPVRSRKSCFGVKTDEIVSTTEEDEPVQSQDSGEKPFTEELEALESSLGELSSPIEPQSSFNSGSEKKAPRPLKSCLSSKKKVKRRPSQQHHVIFGSPAAVEFHKTSPTKNLTPIHPRRAKMMYPLEERVEPEYEEDEVTAENSKILDQFEDELEELSPRVKSITRKRTPTERRRQSTVYRSPVTPDTELSGDSGSMDISEISADLSSRYPLVVNQETDGEESEGAIDMSFESSADPVQISSEQTEETTVSQNSNKPQGLEDSILEDGFNYRLDSIGGSPEGDSTNTTDVCPNPENLHAKFDYGDIPMKDQTEELEESLSSILEHSETKHDGSGHTDAQRTLHQDKYLSTVLEGNESSLDSSCSFERALLNDTLSKENTPSQTGSKNPVGEGQTPTVQLEQSMSCLLSNDDLAPSLKLQQSTGFTTELEPGLSSLIRESEIAANSISKAQSRESQSIARNHHMESLPPKPKPAKARKSSCITRELEADLSVLMELSGESLSSPAHANHMKARKSSCMTAELEVDLSVLMEKSAGALPSPVVLPPKIKSRESIGLTKELEPNLSALMGEKFRNSMSSPPLQLQNKNRESIGLTKELEPNLSVLMGERFRNSMSSPPLQVQNQTRESMGVTKELEVDLSMLIGEQNEAQKEATNVNTKRPFQSPAPNDSEDSNQPSVMSTKHKGQKPDIDMDASMDVSMEIEPSPSMPLRSLSHTTVQRQPETSFESDTGLQDEDGSQHKSRNDNEEMDSSFDDMYNESFNSMNHDHTTPLDVSLHSIPEEDAKDLLSSPSTSGKDGQRISTSSRDLSYSSSTSSDEVNCQSNISSMQVMGKIATDGQCPKEQEEHGKEKDIITDSETPALLRKLRKLEHRDNFNLDESCSNESEQSPGNEGVGNPPDFLQQEDSKQALIEEDVGRSAKCLEQSPPPLEEKKITIGLDDVKSFLRTLIQDAIRAKDTDDTHSNFHKQFDTLLGNGKMPENDALHQRMVQDMVDQLEIAQLETEGLVEEDYLNMLAEHIWSKFPDAVSAIQDILYFEKMQQETEDLPPSQIEGSQKCRKNMVHLTSLIQMILGSLLDHMNKHTARLCSELEGRFKETSDDLKEHDEMLRTALNQAALVSNAADVMLKIMDNKEQEKFLKQKLAANNAVLQQHEEEVASLEEEIVVLQKRKEQLRAIKTEQTIAQRRTQLTTSQRYLQATQDSLSHEIKDIRHQERILMKLRLWEPIELFSDRIKILFEHPDLSCSQVIFYIEGSAVGNWDVKHTSAPKKGVAAKLKQHFSLGQKSSKLFDLMIGEKGLFADGGVCYHILNGCSTCSDIPNTILQVECCIGRLQGLLSEVLELEKTHSLSLDLTMPESKGKLFELPWKKSETPTSKNEEGYVYISTVVTSLKNRIKLQIVFGINLRCARAKLCNIISIIGKANIQEVHRQILDEVDTQMNPLCIHDVLNKVDYLINK